MAMPAERPRVFTIPPSSPFLPTLIAALRDGALVPGFAATGDPLAFAAAAIYLPTRRACRLARDLFLDLLDGDAMLLPRLVAIGDVDEDELIFAEAAGPLAATALDLPPPLGAIERRLLLTQLIRKWAQSPDLQPAGRAPLVADNATAALSLADELARLIDDVITRDVSWDRFDGLAPADLDEYWRLTLEFLQIAREEWPNLLGRIGAMEPALRRDRLIAAEAARLRRDADGPVIAAGSTASMPVTARLLAAIARLPQGAVVLPGLDLRLDAASWRLIGGSPDERAEPCVGHPQFAMQAFLAALGIARDEVVSLGGGGAREALVSEAMRPAEASDHWSDGAGRGFADKALAGVALIEAAGPEEEALAIAVALRETAEAPGKSAALVTPDRDLARRVIAALGRWRIPVDDSGGDGLADTPAGVFARLAAEAALAGLEPVTLLGLLKHPLLRLGAGEGGHEFAISVLERAALRGPRPRPGTRGLLAALGALRQNREALHRADPRARLSDGQIALAEALAQRLAEALAPLESLDAQPRPLSELARRHREVMDALASPEGAAWEEREDAAALIDTLDDLAASAAAATLMLRPADYVEFLVAALQGRVVRRPFNRQARIRILGLLEARLQQADRVVLGGLVEGVWPPQARPDPWLSRPMRQALGLDLPERRIGLTAHDFCQALGAKEVVLVRAAKLGGAPTVASRFLQRLAAVAGEEAWKAAREKGEKYLQWARSLDRPGAVTPVAAPAPTPPVAVRPQQLSVTEIEDWLRDPYTIYAKHILRLAPLEAVDTPPGARDRGSAVHAAVEDFTRAFADALPADALGELLALGRKRFAPLSDFPEAQAFWWPRFERIARWFVEWERERRPRLDAVFAELRGRIDIPAGERTFRLIARADRIERCTDGSYALLDYKTGQVATRKQVRRGFAPQLTLEAAIAHAGGFDPIPPGAAVASIGYVRLRGGEPAGEECPIEWSDTSPPAQAAYALRRLTELVLAFEQEDRPYRSLVHPMWSARYGDYDHLARVKEWSQAAGDSENGAAE